jgi:hypothetical protein
VKRFPIVAGCLAAICAVAGCAQGKAAQPSGGAAAVAGAANVQQLRYGAVPTRNSAVTYQPDVVIVDGGADAVRSVSSDGLTWIIKGNAGHAKELAVGKILFVTSRSAGRVLAVQPDGADLAVTIGPVELADVIQKADISYNKPLDLKSMMFYSAPNLPGAGTVPPTAGDSAAPAGSAPPVDSPAPADSAAPVDSASPSDTGVASTDPSAVASALADRPEPGVMVLPAIALMADSVGKVLPLPTFGSAPASTVGSFALTPTAGASGLGVQFDYSHGGIIMKGQALLHLQAPTVAFHIVIDHGVKSASMRLEGAAGLTMSFDAGIDAASQYALDQRVEIPVDISIPIGGPTPLTITIRQTLLFKSAFGARKATIGASGDFTFSGGFGVDYAGGALRLSGPLGFSGTHNFVNSINGESVGVNGLIIGYQLRMVVGIGAFGFAAGPSFTFVTRMGVTNTAAEAAVPCKFGTLNVQMGVGLGYSLPQVVTDAINFILGALNIKAIDSSGGVEHFETIIKAGESEPNTAGCKV